MTKPELRKYAKEELKKAQRTHKWSEGSPEPGCYMSNDIGYYRGMLAALKFLRKAKN